MEISRVCLVYFSPTGTTKKVVKEIASYFNVPVVKFDLTSHRMKEEEQVFHTTDFVIVGTPVYAGRVPKPMVERLHNMQGHRTPMALIATYGNREYEDALLELKDIAQENGFKAIGAAAVVAEHSLVPSIASNRPDEQDKKILKQFATSLQQRISEIQQVMKEKDLFVKGNQPYRKYGYIAMTPKTTKACNGCMTCYRACPTEAIVLREKAVTNKNRCIGCMRCVRICPREARKVSNFMLNTARKKLEKKCAEDKQIELFF